MTDAEWAVVRAVLPVPAWLEGRGGQPEGYRHRQMLDAVRYVTDNGIKWRSMPVDFPAWDRVYAFFRRWRPTGLAKEFPRRAARTGPRGRWPGSAADRGDPKSAKSNREQREGRGRR